MFGTTTIGITGLLLAIKAAIEIWNLNGAVKKKRIAIILIIVTNWIGVLFFYFYGKERTSQWLK